MKSARKCALCASKIIEREIRAEGQTLYLCPLHSRLCDDVAKLAAAKTKAHKGVTGRTHINPGAPS